jgi:ABC-type transport system involved in multi-copper enzyme maturation permease subunit
VLRSVFHIARNTFRESVRQPIYVILLLASSGIICAHPALATMYTFREQEKMVTDGSMATVLVFGWITAVLCASHAIAREIDTGTVLLILAKPVNRAAFILAKVVGILAALTVFVYVTAIGTLVVLRIATDQFQIDVYVNTGYWVALVLSCLYGAIRNYRTRASFAAQTTLALVVLHTVMLVVVYFLPYYDMGYQWAQGPAKYSLELVKALVLVLFAVWAMGTLATALSTQLNLVGNLTVCGVFFVVGLISDHAFKSIRELRLEELAHMTHAWYLGLLPCALLMWFLAVQHYESRANLRLRLWQVHAGFLALTVVLLARGLRSLSPDIYLQTPSGPMYLLASVLFHAKNHVAEVLYAILPNWQHFWLADALAAKMPIPAGYLLLGLAYIASFIVIFGLLAYVLFVNREVGRQSAR